MGTPDIKHMGQSNRLSGQHTKCSAFDIRIKYITPNITLLKSGGGFFPLHRLDRAHTAFLIIVRRFCLASNLQEEFHQNVFTEQKTVAVVFVK